MKKVPKELDAIADVVLAYKAKPKTKPAKKRKLRAAKLARARRATALRTATPRT